MSRTMSSTSAKMSSWHGSVPSNLSIVPTEPTFSEMTANSRAAIGNTGRMFTENYWTRSRDSYNAHTFWSWQPRTKGNNVCLATWCTLGRLIIVVVVLLVGSISLAVLLAGRRRHIKTETIVIKGPLGTFHGIVNEKPAPYAIKPTSVLDCTTLRPPCLQGALDNGSEDCLHLNVWTPVSNCHDPNGTSCAVKTVLFVLHGDYFHDGGNHDPAMDGRFVASIGDIVVVVPNYRLSVMGFLNGKRQTAPGNVGLDDQLLALEWTRQHIGYFGGNASDVVLMGHGAGATSVGYHLLRSEHELQRYIKKAILMGETPFTRYSENSENTTLALRDLASRVSCAGEDTDILLECLRGVPGSTIYREYTHNRRNPFYPSFMERFPSAPSPQVLLNLTTVPGKNILIGYTSNEISTYMSYLQARFAWNQQAVYNYVNILLHFRGFANAEEIIYYYRYNTSSNTWLMDLLSDMGMVCPVVFFAEYLLMSGSNVYRYLIEPENSDGPNLLHQGLRLVFGVPLRGNASEAEATLCRHLITLWTNFARTGHVPRTDATRLAGYTVSVLPVNKIVFEKDAGESTCRMLRRHFFKEQDTSSYTSGVHTSNSILHTDAFSNTREHVASRSTSERVDRDTYYSPTIGLR
ncbi:acetylcholinesterase-1-like isoform X2 [Ornithodoros turicata]|uniref:acetylcholinesterase-1-like isoform X2 n=1 Tax=Ornithodoros turicata TaxID=34597 RepID=UPI003138A9E2